MRRAATSRRGEGPNIRLARPDERRQLEELQRRSSLALPAYRQQLEAHPDAIAVPAAQIDSGQVLVAEFGGRIAGFAAVIGGELDALFVEPDLWRQGIGSALVTAAVHEARRNGLSLSVIAGPESRPFYESCGFGVEGPAKTRFGPAVKMSR